MIILTRGIPASGKTTWAREWVNEDPSKRMRVNRDDLRAALFCGEGVLPWSSEKLLTSIEQDIVRTAVRDGRSVVVDDMNLRPKYIREWYTLSLGLGCDFEMREFPVDVKEAILRDNGRRLAGERSVGESVISDIARKFLPSGKFLPVSFEPAQDSNAFIPYVNNGNLPKAIMIDVDGTVALNMSGRSPFDWHRVGEDDPNSPVVQAVKAAECLGMKLIFCSGRMEQCRDLTEAWLANHFQKFELFMRPNGDMRKDSFVKYELFDKHIRDTYDIQYVIDDRQQVVNMWRSLGLTVFQVAPGNF